MRNNVRKKIIFITALLCFLSTAFGMSLDDIYIQEKDKVISLQKAVAAKKGSIIKKDDHYLLSIDGYHKELYLTKDNTASDAAMGFGFPDRFFVKLVFANLFPNAQIYLEKDPIGNTDNFGFAKRGIYLKSSGLYTISIINKKNIGVTNDEVNLETTCTVECKGQKPMKCNVIADD